MGREAHSAESAEMREEPPLLPRLRLSIEFARADAQSAIEFLSKRIEKSEQETVRLAQQIAADRAELAENEAALAQADALLESPAPGTGASRKDNL